MMNVGYKPHKPLLSVCIPTYNRPQEVIARITQIEKLKEFILDGFIELCIQDNSNPEIVTLNKSVCDPSFCKYEANPSNIGLGGSVYRLAQRATGRYILFFSDNDEIIVNNLKQILFDIANILETYDAKHERLPLYLLPFICNGSSRYDIPLNTQDITLNQCLLANPSRLPGCLLSSCIIPNNSISLEYYKNLITKSIFPQIIVAFMLVSGKDHVYWHHLPIVVYTNESNPRFNIIKVIDSELTTLDILATLNSVVSDQLHLRKRSALKSLLIMCIWFKANKVNLCFESKNWKFEVTSFVLNNYSYISIKSIILLMLILLPYPSRIFSNFDKIS